MSNSGKYNHICEFAWDVLRELPRGVRILPILGGGAIRSFLDGTQVRDYDLFFRSKEAYIATVVELQHAEWVERLSPAGARVFTNPETGHEFNLIGFFFGSPAEHVARFDFRCCAVAAYWEGGLVREVSIPGAIEDARAKVLTVLNNNGTERTLKRIAKYVGLYGYTLGEIKFSLEGVDVVEDRFPNDEQAEIVAALGPKHAIRRIRSRLRYCPRPIGGGY